VKYNFLAASIRRRNNPPSQSPLHLNKMLEANTDSASGSLPGGLRKAAFAHEKFLKTAKACCGWGCGPDPGRRVWYELRRTAATIGLQWSIFEWKTSQVQSRPGAMIRG
jgi:hypothetical protein